MGGTRSSVRPAAESVNALRVSRAKVLKKLAGRSARRVPEKWRRREAPPPREARLRAVRRGTQTRRCSR